MSFAAPIWLLALAPWGALVAWLLIGRRPSTDVPFIELWRDGGALPRAKREITIPPVGVILLLLAAMCAILTAARPTRNTVAASDLIAVIDESPRMMAASRTAEVGRVLDELRPREVIRTGGSVDAAIRDALARGGVIVVLSDRKPALAGERIVHIAPESVVENVGIVCLAARELPSPQIMLRIRNLSSHRSAEVAVTSGEIGQRRTVQLPVRGEEQNYFIDLPGIRQSATAEVIINDDFAPDNRATLVRGGAPAKLAPLPPLPAELERMVRVYDESRGVRDGGNGVTVAVSDAPDPALPAVVISPGPRSPVTQPTELRVDDHAVAAEVDWKAVLSEQAAAAPLPSGWTPIVRAGGQALVAVRDFPARQVWVGLDSPHWARRSDYVIFFAGAFDWAGGRTTGLVPDSDATLDVRFDQAPTPEWRAKLAKARSGAGAGRTELSGFAALSTVILAGAGVSMFGGSIRRRRKLDSV